jgi:hypothetical protein
VDHAPFTPTNVHAYSGPLYVGMGPRGQENWEDRPDAYQCFAATATPLICSSKRFRNLTKTSNSRFLHFFYLTFSGYTSIEANHYLRLSATLHHASSYIRKMHYLDSPVLLPLSSCSICCSKLHQSISSIPKNPHELLRE